MSTSQPLKPLTPAEIAHAFATMESAAASQFIADHMAKMEKQAALDNEAVRSESKARIKWETYPLVKLQIGYAALYHKEARKEENKSPFVSLFLYTTIGDAISYAKTRIESTDPEQAKNNIAQMKVNFIKRILDISETPFSSFKPCDSNWKSPQFNRRIDIAETGITELTYPVEISARLRKKPIEYTDETTGEVKQGTRWQYGFALNFADNTNDYLLEIKRLSWELIG